MVTIKKAWKCYIQDINNNIYIDTTMGSGSQLIGHGNKLLKKVYKQLNNGTIYTIPNIHTNKVNDLLYQINPHFSPEYIFCNSGTEANIRAIRLARAYTGKKIIGYFNGGWHGGIDGMIPSDGVPDSVKELFREIPYNDKNIFNHITSDLAAVIVEPVQGSNPRSDIKSFLIKLRDACNRKNVLLIFDEVLTGFRIAANGGAGLFNVIPDIITYGKVLGGGLPIGAVGGQPDILKTKNIFYGGTFSANPLTMYSAFLTLHAIKDQNIINYNYLNNIGEYFRKTANSFLEENNILKNVIGCGCVNRVIHTDKFIHNKRERDLYESSSLNFNRNLLKQNVFINTNGILHFSMSHNKGVVDRIISAFKY